MAKMAFTLADKCQRPNPPRVVEKSKDPWEKRWAQTRQRKLLRCERCPREARSECATRASICTHTLHLRWCKSAVSGHTSRQGHWFVTCRGSTRPHCRPQELICSVHGVKAVPLGTVAALCPTRGQPSPLVTCEGMSRNP